MVNVLSDNQKLFLLRKGKNDYLELRKQFEILQSSGITMTELSNLLGISRRTCSRLIRESYRKNSIFFHHLLFISSINELYSSMPDKVKRKAERKLERKKRTQSTVNRVVYRPETDKHLSSE